MWSSDAGTEAGSDAAADAGNDAAPEAAPDTGTGQDAGTGAEAGTDAGVGTGGDAGTTACAASGSSTYYVATTGNDGNAGTSAAPFATIEHAYSQVVAGDCILVEPGVYKDYYPGWGIRLNKSGAAGKPITLRSVTRFAAIIDGSGQSDRDACFYIDGANYNVIDGFTMRNCLSGGVSSFPDSNGQPAAYNTVINNEIYAISRPTPASTGAGGQGIGDCSPDHDNYYGNNYIHDIGASWDDKYDHGMYVGGDNLVVANNVLVHNIYGMGLQVAAYANVNNMRVYNNTTVHNQYDGIVIWSDTSSYAFNNLVVSNNIAYGNAGYGIRGCGTMGSVVLSNNVSYGNSTGNFLENGCGGGTATWTNNALTQQDPLFVNSSSDFHLQAGSPAIGAGLNLSNLGIPALDVDFDGYTRPATGAWDIGAYQHH